MYSYPEVFSKLTYETALVTFLKKDGTVRVMLCTRNLDTVSLRFGFQGAALGGHDNRCNIKNGNMAVFDLILGEARSFNIERVLSVYYSGIITNNEQLDACINAYAEFKEKYEATHEMSLSMDTFDGGTENAENQPTN